MFRLIEKLLTSRLDLLFFYLFIISIPLQKRHIFNQEKVTINGHFFEWQAYAIYLSDILFGLVLLFWLISVVRIIRRKQAVYQYIKVKNIFLALFGLLTIAFLSFLGSSFLDISLYRLVKLIEYGFLFIYIVKNIATFKQVVYSLVFFIGTSIFQAILAIFQYFRQRSLGLKILGEVDLGPDLLNVAKILVDGEKLIRAYGTFPHANVLGGFLFISLVFIWTFVFLEMIKFTVNKRNGLNKLNFRRRLVFLIFLSCILFLGFVLAFSRSAWLALAFAPLLFMLCLRQRERKLLLNQIKVLKFKYIFPIIYFLAFAVLIIIIFLPPITAKTVISQNTEDFAFVGRIFYAKIALSMIKKSPELGLGLGTFTLEMPNFVENALKWWQFQPVHNVYLLIACEIGLIGLFIFSLFLALILHKAYQRFRQAAIKKKILFAGLIISLVGFLIIMLFDHYPWTIQQGALSFWLILGLLVTVTTKLQTKTII